MAHAARDVQNGSIHKMIWSLDAFEESGGIQTHVVETLRNFTALRQVTIEPVYVLSPEQLDVSLEFTPPWIRQYRPAAQKALEQKLKHVDLSGLTAPKVLINTHASLRDSVRTLTSHARVSSADLIVVGSHGRKGIDRLILGSFAESLLLQSKIPVLVVGPATRMGGHGFDPILFPTDFSDGGFPIFARVLRLARDLKAKVKLFHTIPNPIEPVFQSGVYLLGGGWVPVPAFLEKEERKKREAAGEWLSKAKKFEVPVEFVIERSQGGTVETILKFAKEEKVGLVAMAAQSGPVASALIGSVSRQVVRSSSCPVWVLRKGAS